MADKDQRPMWPGLWRIFGQDPDHLWSRPQATLPSDSITPLSPRSLSDTAGLRAAIVGAMDQHAKEAEAKAKPGHSPGQKAFSLSRDDAIFWIGVAVFGDGVYLLAEHPAYAVPLIIAGVTMLAWSNRGHMPRPPFRMAVLVLAMIVTCALVLYDLYDRHVVHPSIEQVTTDYYDTYTPNEKRTIVDVTPEYLMSLYDNVMSFQGDKLLEPYVGMWMHITQTVADIKGNTIWAYIKENDGGLRTMNLNFDPAWVSRISVLARGQKFKSLCQITAASVTALRFDRCELEADSR